MKKKIKLYASIILVVAILTMLGLRLIILIWGSWDYFQTDNICSGQNPTPPAGLGEQAPLMLYEVKPLFVVTDHGIIYPGDEYIIYGDIWSGAATLLWTGMDGATFLVKFRSGDYPEYTCRWFAPVGDYR